MRQLIALGLVTAGEWLARLGLTDFASRRP